MKMKGTLKGGLVVEYDFPEEFAYIERLLDDDHPGIDIDLIHYRLRYERAEEIWRKSEMKTDGESHE